MQAVVQYGSPVPLSKAKRLAEAAESEASKNGWSMVIAIVDSASQVVLVHRMDHAQYGSVKVAQAKAKTTVSFKRPSKVFEEAVAKGGLGLRILATEGICPLEGGTPIIEGGKLVGAIGVSGGQSHEDGAVAIAALLAVDG
jgi:glc operon protein GlcG